jgi:hypothetical protein
VFLDTTGRRGRRVRLACAVLALLSALWLGALVTGAVGFGELPSLRPALSRLALAPRHRRLETRGRVETAALALRGDIR